jgi:cob(I)alamin adenosyltransferase
VLGLCRLHEPDAAGQARLQALQNDLFDVGADLCVPISAEERAGTAGRRLRVGAARVLRLEGWIDAVNAPLPELKSFVLPGGSPLASHLHLARTVCRRAERRVHALLVADDAVNPHTRRYLNRLSDLLFVLARAAAGSAEILWEPTDEADL